MEPRSEEVYEFGPFRLDPAERQLRRGEQVPDEHRFVAQQAAEARVRGQLRKSRELLRHAADLARLRNLPDTAGTYLKLDSAGDALLGNCATPRSPGELADSGPGHIGLAALVPTDHIQAALLALCASPSLAEQAEALNPRWLSGSNVSPAKAPVTRAAIAFGLGDPGKAIELLDSARQYEIQWRTTSAGWRI